MPRLKPAGEHAAVAGEVDKVARGSEDVFGTRATSRPVSVSAISLARRSTSCAPISRSSSRTCMDKAGWVTAQSSAARPKWR